MNARRWIVSVVLVLLLSAPCAYGWGSGHCTQAQMVMDGLPQEIKDFLGEQNCKDIVGGKEAYCGFPDSPRVTEELLGKAALDELIRLGNFKVIDGKKVAHSGALHQDVNAAVAFDLLCMAFAEKDPKHAAVWIGCVIHTMGDNTCHLAQTAYGGVIARMKIKAGPGLYDLSSMTATELGRKKLKDAMAGYKPKMLGENPDDVLVKLVLSTAESQNYGAKKESGLSAAWNLDEDGKPNVTEEGLDAMADLGAYGAKGILDAVVTAWEFAKAGKKVALNDELIKKGRELSRKFVDSKPLSDDSIYVGTLDSKPAGPAVGVLLENSTYMGSARFSYIGCVVLSQIMRCYKEANVPYLPLDIRKVEKDGLPDVDKMPVLVLCSGGFYVNDVARGAFAKYVKDGGKLVWIGGTDKGMLGKLSKSLKDADRELLPVGVDYEDAKGEGAKAVARVKVQYLAEFADALGKEPLKFVNNPNTAGWTTARCNLQIVADDKDVKPLVAVTDGSKTMNIAAAVVEGGKARHVFLPQYLLLPFVLSQDQTMDFARPTLDSVGKKIILTSTRMLAPDLTLKEK